MHAWKTHIILHYDNSIFMSAVAELNLELLPHRKLAYFSIHFFPQIMKKKYYNENSRKNRIHRHFDIP